MAENLIRKVYWDACIWIGLINEEVGLVENCEFLIEQAKEGKIQIWTSSLTLAEVYKKKCDGETIELAEEDDRNFESYVSQEYFVEVQVDHDIGVLARQLLRRNSELKKPNDAIHLATAIIHNLDEFHTMDRENLLPLNGKIIRLDGTYLVICEPPPPNNQQTSFGLISS